MARLPQVAVAVATAVLWLVLGTVAIGTLRLAFGVPLGRWPLPAAAVATVVWLAWWSRRRWGGAWLRPFLATAGSVAAIVLAAIVVVGAVPDTTYDGQWLHQEAVLRLVEGWNPVTAELGPPEVADAELRARLNGYPKASWIAGAAVVGLSGHVDHAGWTTLALAVSAWLLAWVGFACGLGIPPPAAAVLAAACAANPVVLTQMLNSQLDGDLASCLLVIVLAPLLRRATGSRTALAAVAAAAALACGFKLTGGALAGVLALVAVAATWHGRRVDRGLAAAVAAGLVAGGLVLGFHPYVTNLVRHHHPLYPVLGPDAAAVWTTPRVNRAESLLVATFSRSRHAATSAEAVARLADHADLKLPWSVRRDEVEAFAVPDVRVGGFGPLFAATVLAGLVALAIGWRRAGRAVLVPLVGTLFSVMVFPQPWFARFVPQLWLVPLLAAAAVLGSPVRWRRTIGALVVGLALADAGLVAFGHVTNAVRHGRAVEGRLRQLVAVGGPLRVDLRPFGSARARLAELGADFEIVAEPDRSLQTVLGAWLPTVRHVEVVDGGGGARLELDWDGVHGAERYRVDLQCTAAGGAAGSFRQLAETGSTSCRSPLPCRPAAIAVRACNQLGCGPPATAAVPAGG